MKTQELSVFGATGFIGSRYREISKLKCIPIARDNHDSGGRDVVYFISTTHNYNVFDDTTKDINTNLLVLMDVLSKFKDSNKVFNFISSWFVYGDVALPAKEDVCCKPKGFYSITKRAAEELLISYCQTFGIRYRILRLCNVYGKGDMGVSSKKNALQYLINEMRKGNDIKLYHNGEFYRDYMHIDDVCRAIDLCVIDGPVDSTINIGTGNKIKFRDVIDIAHYELRSISNIIDVQPPDFHKIIQVKDFYMDTKKLCSVGFSPIINIEEGIKELCYI